MLSPAFALPQSACVTLCAYVTLGELISYGSVEVRGNFVESVISFSGLQALNPFGCQAFTTGVTLYLSRLTDLATGFVAGKTKW